MNRTNHSTQSVSPLPCGGGASFDEKELVLRLKSGDADAFEVLVRQYGGRMMCVARRFLRSEQDVADAMQDAFVSAFRAISGFQENAGLGTWLHRITVNACLMLLRSRTRKEALPLDDLLPQFDEGGHHTLRVSRQDEVFSRLETEENRSHVRACIDRLPEPYRAVLIMRDIEEFDTEQTALSLGTTEGNVKTRLHRARQMLRTLLLERYPVQDTYTS